jgi:hypothetical protein
MIHFHYNPKNLTHENPRSVGGKCGALAYHTGFNFCTRDTNFAVQCCDRRANRRSGRLYERISGPVGPLDGDGILLGVQKYRSNASFVYDAVVLPSEKVAQG